MANHMVRLAASVVSPFYFILLGLWFHLVLYNTPILFCSPRQTYFKVQRVCFYSLILKRDIGKILFNFCMRVFAANWRQSLSKLYRLCTDYVQTCTDYVQTMYRLCTDYLQTMYRLSTDYVQTIYRLCTGYLKTM